MTWGPAGRGPAGGPGGSCGLALAFFLFALGFFLPAVGPLAAFPAGGAGESMLLMLMMKACCCYGSVSSPVATGRMEDGGEAHLHDVV